MLGSLSLSGWGRRHWSETGLVHLDLPAMSHHRRLSRGCTAAGECMFLLLTRLAQTSFITQLRLHDARHRRLEPSHSSPEGGQPIAARSRRIAYNKAALTVHPRSSRAKQRVIRLAACPNRTTTETRTISEKPSRAERGAVSNQRRGLYLTWCVHGRAVFDYMLPTPTVCGERRFGYESESYSK